MRRIADTTTVLLLTVFTSLIMAAAVGVAQPNNSEQVVFSGTGFGTFDGTPTPVGFWIWCEAESENPYAGECAGSMYFYALRITKHVIDAEEPGIVENADESYTMHVASTDGSVDCFLTNEEPTRNGPRNTVDVECGAPAGSGTSTRAVVKVTGPGD